MLDIHSLLPKIGSSRNRLKFVEGDLINTLRNNLAYVVETGSLLAYDDRNLTQTFVSPDPIGFAEILAGRDVTLTVSYTHL